jgi:large subunit ribosomal protein L6
MSRVGRKPVAIPAGVQVKVEGGRIKVKGPKGELTRAVVQQVQVAVENGQVVVSRGDDERRSRALHGLMRAEVQNMINGVTQGFQKTLEINGVGYRAALSGRTLTLTIGFSHPVSFPLPPGIEASVDKQTIVTIKGSDRYLVGQTAADLRALRKPEPYKGKGIKYAGEKIIRKEGKTGK